MIRAEENRILFEMCQTISQNRVEIKDAVTAIAEIDVFRAKAKVGLRMKGIIPEVRMYVQALSAFRTETSPDFN